jgi:hypothetical protein
MAYASVLPLLNNGNISHPHAAHCVIREIVQSNFDFFEVRRLDRTPRCVTANCVSNHAYKAFCMFSADAAVIQLGNVITCLKHRRHWEQQMCSFFNESLKLSQYTFTLLIESRDV